MKVGEFLDICDYTAKIRIKMEQLGMTWTSEYAYRERWRKLSDLQSGDTKRRVPI